MPYQGVMLEGPDRELKLKVDLVVHRLSRDPFIKGCADVSRTKEFAALEDTVHISVIGISKVHKKKYILEVPLSKHWVSEATTTVDAIVAEVYKCIRLADEVGPRPETDD